jgi:hypothetical protein
VTSLGVAMVTGFLFSLVGGQADDAAPGRIWLRGVLLMGLIVIVLFDGLADLPTEMLPLDDSQVTVRRMWEEDFAARQIGATWTAEYVPIWVEADRSVVGLPPPDLEPFEPRDLSPEDCSPHR